MASKIRNSNYMFVYFHYSWHVPLHPCINLAVLAGIFKKIFWVKQKTDYILEKKIQIPKIKI